MIELFQVALEVQDFCEANHWEYCFIGGVALQRWGEPRVTQDVDLTLVTGFGNENCLSSLFLKNIQPELADLEGILARNGSKLDWGYIQDHLQPLLDLKETHQIMDQLQELRQRFEC